MHEIMALTALTVWSSSRSAFIEIGVPSRISVSLLQNVWFLQYYLPSLWSTADRVMSRSITGFKHHPRLSIRQLEAFRAFMLVRTTKGAAELLNISQPAISRLIDQLEKDIEFELFDRSAGRLVPTPEADILFEEVERTFVSADRITEFAQDIRSVRIGHLTIASMPALASGFLPFVIAKFALKFPRTRVSLLISPSSKIEELSTTQNIDFGIGEYPFFRTGIHVEPFYTGSYVLGVPSQSQWVNSSQVNIQELRGASFISLSTNTAARHLIDRAFYDASMSPAFTYDAQNSGVIAKLISNGLGVGLIDPFTAREYIDSGVSIVHFDPCVAFKIAVLHPSYRPLSRAAREFLSLMKKSRTEWLGLPVGTNLSEPFNG